MVDTQHQHPLAPPVGPVAGRVGPAGTPADGAGPWLLAVVAAALAGALLAVAAWGVTGAGRTGAGAGATPPTSSSSLPANLGTSAAAAPAPSGSGAAVGQPDPDAGGGPTAGAGGAPYQPAAGECVAITGSGASARAASVDCAASHLFEVAGVLDAAGYASNPTDVEWAALLQQRCPGLVQSYVGPTYDPHGILALRVSAPTAQEWANGDHQGECLLSAGNDATGSPVPFTGRVQALDQARPVVVGDCLALGAGAMGAGAVGAAVVPAEVACSAAHEVEVVTSIDLTGRCRALPRRRRLVDARGGVPQRRRCPVRDAPAEPRRRHAGGGRGADPGRELARRPPHGALRRRPPGRRHGRAGQRRGCAHRLSPPARRRRRCGPAAKAAGRAG